MISTDKNLVAAHIATELANVSKAGREVFLGALEETPQRVACLVAEVDPWAATAAFLIAPSDSETIELAAKILNDLIG